VRPHAYVPPGSAPDPVRAAEEAARRARASVRRYCAANRLNRLGTLTYRGAGCHDGSQVRADLAEFFRGLRDRSSAATFPYLWVPEWHKSGHGLHAHFAVGRFLRRGWIEGAWRHGFVHIKLLGNLPVGSGALSEARSAARYLSKYVAKDLPAAQRRDFGAHRYDVAQGFQPERVRLTGDSVADVLAQASGVAEAAITERWWSGADPGWSGPPAIWAQFGR
jgi:hypothetical protein